LLHSIHHGLPQGHACAENGAHSDRATPSFPAAMGMPAQLILRELAHVAEHVHADALVEHFCNSSAAKGSRPTKLSR